MLTSTLQQLGLSEKQAKIYLACLELGETSIKEMAEKAGIKRTTIYDIIDDMTNAGYIRTTSKGKKIKYIATEPEDLVIIIKKREALLKQIIPQLNSINNTSGLKPKILFYEGVDGLKKVYEDLLKYPNSQVYGWASEDMETALGEQWCMNYVARRSAKKIKEDLIYPLTEITGKYKADDKVPLRKSKTVDPQKYTLKTEINIYTNKITIASARDKIGVIIESAPIAETMKMIFQMCWENI